MTNKCDCHHLGYKVHCCLEQKKKARAIISSDQRAVTLPSHKSSGGRSSDGVGGATCLVRRPISQSLCLSGDAEAPAPRYVSTVGPAALTSPGRDSWRPLLCKTCSCGMEDTSSSRPDLNQGWASGWLGVLVPRGAVPSAGSTPPSQGQLSRGFSLTSPALHSLYSPDTQALH